MSDSIDAASNERRLQIQIFLVLASTSLLLSLVFSQRGAVFTPPALVAASVLPSQPAAFSMLPVTPTQAGAAPRSANVAAPASPALGSGGNAGAGFNPASLPPPPAGATPSSFVDAAAPPPPAAGEPSLSAAPPPQNSPNQSAGAPGALALATPSVTTPVPEPATWLFLIIGVAIIGDALRSRPVAGISAPTIIAA